MSKLINFLLLILFFIGFVSAEATLHTPQIITVSSSEATIPISFFNDGLSQNFNAAFVSDNGFARLEDYSIYVEEESYGSFSIIIGENALEPGLYFGKVIISDTSGAIFNIPVIYGKESDLPRKFDVSIEFDESLDSNYISDELVISPNIKVYKLDYNPSTSNNLNLIFIVYDLDGNVIDSTEDVLAVSTQSSFEYFSNLGTSPPNTVVLAAVAKNSGLTWLDVSQVQLPISPQIFFSPPVEKKEYSSWMYLGIFALLVISMILLSYFWNARVMNTANDWRSRVNYIKKTQFSDSAKAMRKLKDQKEVLERAYASHYITRESYNQGISTIENLSKQLNKRL
ncbi:MAG: hypothetical protein ACP5NS_00025 [Candidatus Pacearchaeota archaeon]